MCPHRIETPVTYIVSNQTLTADEIARMTNNPDYGVGPDVRRWSDGTTDESRQLFCGVEERGFLLLKN